jgi:mannose-6-phosphate isomerase-like protein (cupin superfamily)
MTLKSENIWISFVLFLLCLVTLSCASTPRFYFQYENQFSQFDLDRILAENPLAATENIKVTTLGQAQQVSHHIVQVRDRELPHIHKEHDVTVVMLRGQGYLMLDRRRIDLAPADVLFIPRSLVHYFVNTFHEPTVAFVVYSPPFDGKDTIPLEKP